MKHLSTLNSEILQDRQSTFLTAEAASGTNSLTVKSIERFVKNLILCIGELGNETTEIIKISNSDPTGTTITLASNLVYTHSPYAVVRIIPYDQVEFSHSATETGAKTVLWLGTFTVGAMDTVYDDKTYSSGFYFIRFKETVTNTFTDYSDPIPFAGIGTNTVGFAITYALKRNKLDSFTDFLDYQFCIDEVNACLQFITGKLKRWTKLFKINYVAGQTQMGVQRVSLPVDIWENRGTKSIMGVRIGGSIGLTALSQFEMEDEMDQVMHTQVRTLAVVGSTTLEVDNSYDFEDTGNVNVYVNNSLYVISYTGVTRSATAGVLTGIPATGTGAITVQIPVDTDVWYGEDSGEPNCFTTDSDGNLLIWPLCDNSFSNMNVYMDYFTAATSVDSDTDTLDLFRYDAVKHWLTWAIRSQLKNDGKRDYTDGDYIQFSQILSDYIRNEIPSNNRKRQPNINSITY
jgi:hypothetical protein